MPGHCLAPLADDFEALGAVLLDLAQALGNEPTTPEQITLVQSSLKRLGRELPAMPTRFYQELFRRDPALRPLFAMD